MASIIKRVMTRVFGSGGSERSAKAKKNIFQMIFLKGGSILVNFLLVPITINYVDQTSYGIWLTLSSMVAWFSFFDIGLNNGLRNRLTEALANEDYKLCKRLVSTTYAILSIIFIPIMGLLLLFNNFVDWDSLLNISVVANSQLRTVVGILIIYFCINFILSTINTILTADQRPADASWRQFLQQLSSLVIIFLLSRFTQGNLVYLCLGLSVSPIVICAIFNITLFKGRYRHFAPSFKTIDFSTVPSLMKLGAQFFIIQIAAIIQYQATNFIIIRYFGADDVTSYNIAYRYFSILFMAWGILTTPLWSATTDALVRGDIDWVINAKRKYLRILMLFSLGGVLMLALSHWFYGIWVGHDIIIPFMLSLWVFLYNITMMFGNIYVNIINGSGQLKVQAYASMVSPFLFLGLCALFIYSHMGLYSILIAAIISNFNGLILAPIQCHNLLKLKTND